MPLEALILKYGVVAVFLGAGLEGEAAVVASGVLAHRGLLPLVPTCIAAALGSCVADQLLFFAGRYWREHRFVQAMMRKSAYAKAIRFLERYPVSFILAFRFIYGLRTVSPVAIGTSQIETRLYVPLNIVAAAVWGPLFTLIGFRLGKAAEPLLARLSHYGLIAAGVAAGIALIAWAIVHVMRNRRAARRTPTSTDAP